MLQVISSQSTIKYFKYNYHEFLFHLNTNSFFCNPNDEFEVKNIVPFNCLKAIGSNTVPKKDIKNIKKMLKILKRC